MIVESLVYLIVVETILLILAMVSDLDGIKTGLKVKLMRGYSRIFFIGKDGSMILKAKRLSNKKDDKDTFKDGAFTYNIDSKKKFFFDKKPCWIYKEGDLDPIDPQDIQNVEGIDGEFMTALLEKARATGQVPFGKMDKDKQLLLIGVLIGAGASIVNLLFQMRAMGV